MKTMARRRQAEKITLIVKGEPSVAALPVEIGSQSALHGTDSEADRWFCAGRGRETGMVSK